MSKRSAFLILLALLSTAALWLIKPFLSTVVLSLTLVIGLWPIYQFFKKLLFGNRWIASLLTTLLLAVLILFPAIFLVRVAADQAMSLIHYIPESKDVWLPVIEEWSEKLKIDMSWEAVVPELIQKGTQLVSQFSPRIFVQTTQFVFYFIMALLVTFFLFVDGPSLEQELIVLSPLEKGYSEHLAYEIHNTLKACLYGYIFTAIAQSCLAGIGFSIAGLPIAVILGVATFFVSFVPIIGATGVWLPVTIYLFTSGHWKMGIFMALYGTFVISGIDNFLKPILIQGRTKIHPVLIFLSILGGLKAFGPIGFLIGPLLVAIFLASIRIYKRDFLGQV